MQDNQEAKTSTDEARRKNKKIKKGEGLWPIAYWGCGFESRRGHGYLCCECCTKKVKGKRHGRTRLQLDGF
jgi:hypothetical protein